jgi:hypothetical protein
VHREHFRSSAGRIRWRNSFFEYCFEQRTQQGRSKVTRGGGPSGTTEESPSPGRGLSTGALWLLGTESLPDLGDDAAVSEPDSNMGENVIAKSGFGVRKEIGELGTAGQKIERAVHRDAVRSLVCWCWYKERRRGVGVAQEERARSQ